MRTKVRQINGILLLDKPVGITSNSALQSVKKMFNAKKAGHTGSLDPLASGMLPICLGQATKFSQFLLNADKCYQVTGKLGVKTASGDAEGKVTATAEVKGISERQIKSALKKFLDDIEQIPSMYSAIKHHGQPLYKLARKGEIVKRKPRKVTIYELELIKFEENQIELQIHCSKGTYIRTLIEDIGDELNCGAHVIALRRLSIGPFSEQQMIPLGKLENLLDKCGQTALDSLLLPTESVLADLPEVRLSEAAAFYLKQGQPVISPHAPSEGMVRLMMKDGGFLGVGEIMDDGKVAPRRLITK